MRTLVGDVSLWKISETIRLFVDCETVDEIDYNADVSCDGSRIILTVGVNGNARYFHLTIREIRGL